MAEKTTRFDKAKKRIGAALAPKPEDAENRDAMSKLATAVQEHGVQLDEDANREVPPIVLMEIFDADEWKCRTCGSANAPLQAHPVRFEHEAGGENEAVTGKDEAVTTCATCHEAVHELKASRTKQESGAAEPGAGGEGDEQGQAGGPEDGAPAE